MRSVWAGIVVVALAAGSVVGVAGAASADTGLTVTLTGSESLGGTLSAFVTGGDGADTPTYQWFNNGSAIENRTEASYTPKLSDKDDDISVHVKKGGLEGDSPKLTIHAGSLAFAQPSVAAGGAIDLRGLNFAPGVAYQLSSQFWSTTATAGADGALAASVPFPLSTRAGSYSVSATLPLGKLVTASITVVRPPDAPTMAATAPRISGKVQVGVTVQADLGSWTPGTTFTYRWMLNNRTIAGAVSPRYAIQASDLGGSLKVRIVGTADAATVTATSDAQKVVAAPFSTQPGVKIKGVLKKGHKLKAVTVGSWLPAPTKTTYAWYVNGAKVGSSKTITVKKSWKHKHVTVTLRGSRAGYVTVTRTSTTAKKVR